MQAKIRLHYMDTLRASMMILGIFYHAAAIYGDNWWYVSSGDMNWYLRALTEVLHTFRMPVFFIVSGFFTALLMTKASSAEFMKSRLVRLGIPLFFCGFTINFAMNGLATNRTIPTDPYIYVFEGYWLGHLWFLGSLIVYTLLAILAKNLLAKCKPKNGMQYFSFITILFLAYVLLLIPLDLPQSLHSIRYLFVSVGVTIQYLPLFVIGYLCFSSEVFLKSFLNARANLLILVVFLAAFYLLRHTSVGKNVALWIGVKYLCFYSASGLVIYVFSRIFSKKLEITKSISEASYTIYLVHQPLLIVLFHIMPSQLHWAIAFALLSFATLFVSYFFHILCVKRYPVLGLLFNGKIENLKVETGGKLNVNP